MDKRQFEEAVSLHFVFRAETLHLNKARFGTEMAKNCERSTFHSFACACASTNQSSLSAPRETSVNKSAVSASPASLASSMAVRALAPNFASALDNAATCSLPEEMFSG